MFVTVVHLDRETNKRQVVATVSFDGDDVQEAMEYAFRWTQNLDGSWSMGEEFTMDGRLYENPDYNGNVIVQAPLPNHFGRTYGIRSTSVGDFMFVNNDTYRVASFGFDKVEA